MNAKQKVKEVWRHLAGGALTGTLLGAAVAQIGHRLLDVPFLITVMSLCAGLFLLRWGSVALALALLVLAALVLLAAFTPLVPRALAALTEAQAPAQADATVVLSGGLNCASGQPSVSSTARLICGLELWQEGYAPMLVLSSYSDVLTLSACPRLSDLQRAQLGRLLGQGAPQQRDHHC